MNQQSLELILDLYKDEKIDKEDAVNIIEDLAGNNYKPYYFWTTSSQPNICTYNNDVKDPLTPPYTIFANNKTEQNGNNQMPKVQM